MFILNVGQKLAQRLEKQYSIRHEQRDSFADDNDSGYEEL